MITGTSDWVQNWADIAPWRVAIREIGSDRVLHYGELSARAWQWYHALIGQGVKPGDRVALLAHNTPTAFEVLIACLRLGAVYTPLNWRLAPPELVEIVEHCTARVLVYDGPTAGAASALCKTLPDLRAVALDKAIRADHVEYGSMMAQASTTPVLTERDPETLGMLLYTSGTTGRPKGVMIPHRQIFWNAINTVCAIDLGPNDRSLACLPLFHTGGLNCLATPSLYRGGTILLMGAFDPSLALATIQSEQATVLIAVPTMYQMLLEAGLDRYDTSGMSTLLCGGAPCPEPLLDAWLDRGFNFRQGYGMTEVGPNCFSLPSWMKHRKRGAVGQPIFHSQAKVCAPLGEVGELCLAGPHVSAGYWDAKATFDEVYRDGWFHTGDLARQDDDGFFYIAGRQKDMFISGGENVYPAEIESVILEHEAVAEVAVIGIPHERWGEVGLAAVVPRHRFDVEQLRAHCVERLAKFKVPKVFELVSDLPKNPSGKVLKLQVRDQCLSAAKKRSPQI